MEKWRNRKTVWGYYINQIKTRMTRMTQMIHLSAGQAGIFTDFHFSNSFKRGRLKQQRGFKRGRLSAGQAGLKQQTVF